MAEINLLKCLPKSNRKINIRKKKKSSKNIKIAKEFGKEFFDGPRACGYGGYYYDGRWKPVAHDIYTHYKLKKSDKFLDIGCAKGFLVKEMLSLGIDSYGIDISDYAIKNSEKETFGRLHRGSAISLPFPDKTFECVVSINTLHNFNKKDFVLALKEMIRVGKKSYFIQVDSYLNNLQKKKFEDWVLTAECHGYPKEWIKLFNKAGYKGDWYWTITE
ncbi:MAG: methyltransferase [Alphaproteobacteria bacterium TMED62]|nr:MAG: methyltransferase [Alphaproteobacteria bacterium TMED62]|tara:strand:- start:14560 stop:15210 length:651 start_codon:yes stop_codon:yes gene_type:complete